MAIKLPMPIFTPRLEIRPPQKKDAKAINEGTIESLSELKVFMPWALKAPSMDETDEVVEGMMKKWEEQSDFTLSIFCKETGKLIGGTGLHRFDLDVPRFEIGYWCRTSETGKGYITESTTALLHYAFKELKARRVEIRCDSDNKASEAIMKKCGLDYEGRLRNFGLKVDGKTPRDELVYSAINLDKVPELNTSW